MYGLAELGTSLASVCVGFWQTGRGRSAQGVDSGVPVLYKAGALNKAQSYTQLRGAVEALQERPKNAKQVFMLLSLLRSIYKSFAFEGGSSFFDLKGLRL